jgi:molecular chaperone GrpE
MVLPNCQDKTVGSIFAILNQETETACEMMMKKKREQEEKKDDFQSKTTDNKESNNLTDNTGPADSGTSWDGDEVKINGEKSNGSGSSADKTIADVKAVEEKLAEMQDRYLRLSAEFDNYRKRTLREKMDMSKYAGENLLLAIIPVMDDFERALSHMDSATDSQAIKNGIDLIYLKLSDFLKQNGLKEIESLDSNFNVDIHEAVAKVQVSEEDKKGKVIDVLQKGYYLQDKVLRFAKVVVGE